MRSLFVIPLLAAAYPAFAGSPLLDRNDYDTPYEFRDAEFGVRLDEGGDYPRRFDEYKRAGKVVPTELLDARDDTASRRVIFRKLRGPAPTGDGKATGAQQEAPSTSDATCEPASGAEQQAFRLAAIRDGGLTKRQADRLDFSCPEPVDPEQVASIDDTGSTSSGNTTWADEFDAGWQDAYSATEHWHSGNGRKGYGESAYSLNNPGELATVQNGELVLRSKPGCEGGKMCTVELIGKKPFVHGRVEVRAKVSNSADAFNTPLWSTGVQNGDGKVWPAIGEIDGAEFAMNGGGENGKPHFTVHTKGGDPWGHASVTTGNAPNIAGDGQYHTFAIERSPNEIKQIVDGKVTGTITRKMVTDAGGDPEAVFNRPHVVRLNTGADNAAGWADNKGKAPEPSEMRIDSVRYFK